MNRLRGLVRDVRRTIREAAPSSKFIPYFQLLDAFREAGCPVCTLVEQSAVKTLDGLMYERVNDPVTRDRLIESHGFCNWHAWMLPRIHNSASGVAIIYRHLLGETLEHLQRSVRDTRSESRWQRLWGRLASPQDKTLPIRMWRRKRARCHVCTYARTSEQDHLKTILEFIGEPEFAEAFSRSAGLCLPHLYASVEMGPDHPNLHVLLTAHEARWKDLAWELEEFSRKFDYRYADEPKGRESSSWHGVLEVFVGRAGLFGPERGDGPMPQGTGVPLPTSPQAEPPRSMGVEQPAEIEQVRFENEKLRRRIETLLCQREEDRQARLSLEFQVLKLTSDLKAMAVDLGAATRGRPVPARTPPENTGSDGQPPIPGGDRA